MSTSALAVELHTPRLLLRPLQLSDAPQTQLLFPHWEIVKYLNAIAPWPYPPNDTDLTVFKREGMTGVNFAPIGNVNAYHTPNDNIAHVDLRTLQHQGDNAVAAVRTLANMDLRHHPRGSSVWFDVLGFKTMRAPKAVGNIASRRISEKTGMRLVGIEERNFVSGRLPCEIWEITAEEWHKTRALSPTNQQR